MDYPVELAAPDITAYRAGNTGIDYVTTFDSGRPGAHVMVNALTHGNELCGAIALDFLLRNEVRPARGKLTLSFANVEAYGRFDLDRPTDSRYVEEDFNRLWSSDALAGPLATSERRRAAALRPLVDSVDYLLDIHSMFHATVPIMLCGLTGKSVALARRIGAPEWLLVDAGHQAGRRLRDYGRFGDDTSPATALLIECGQHWQPSSAAMAIATSLRFLSVLGVLAADRERTLRLAADAALHGAANTMASACALLPQRTIEVTDVITIQSDRFRFAASYKGMEIIARAGTVIAEDAGCSISTPYDDCVLIMPAVRLTRGDTAVRLGRITG